MTTRAKVRFFVLMLLMLLAGFIVSIVFPQFSLAGGAQLNTPLKGYKQTLSLSADGSSTLDGGFTGTYGYQVSIITSADDAVTFALTDKNGITLYTTTTTAATSGEIELWPVFYRITGPVTYTLSGMASGTATIEVVGVPE